MSRHKKATAQTQDLHNGIGRYFQPVRALLYVGVDGIPQLLMPEDLSHRHVQMKHQRLRGTAPIFHCTT